MTHAALLLVMSIHAMAAADPAAPSVQDRLLTTINRGDPDMTASPAPVAELVAAAELAASTMVHAETVYISELLGYLHMALELAYRRTRDPAHLAAEIAALDRLLTRTDLLPEISARAKRWREAACTSLSAVHGISNACTSPRASAPPTPVPARASSASPTTPATEQPPDPKPPDHALMAVPSRPTPTRSGQGLVIAGVVTLGTGVALAAVAGALGHRRIQTREEVLALHDMVDGFATPEQAARGDALSRDYYAMGPQTLALALASGATVVVAAILTGIGARRLARSNSRAALVPTPGGLALRGAF